MVTVGGEGSGTARGGAGAGGSFGGGLSFGAIVEETKYF